DHVSESRNLHLPVCGSRGGHDRADRRPVEAVGGLLPWRRHPPQFSGLGNAMPTALPEPSQLNTPELLEAFFEASQDGFFFMMLDQPVELGRGSGVDKDAVLDYVFSHQRMTKVNPAMAQQFRAKPAELIGMTPRDFFRHDIAAGRRGGRKLDVAWLETRQSRTDSGIFRLGDASLADRVDQTMQIVRRIASELRPSVLDQLGLEAAIESLVRETTQRTGIAVCLHADDFPRLPDAIASHAYRIIVEADAGMVISGEADGAAALLAGLETSATDLVLLDVSMPGGLFLDTLRELRTRHPTIRVLALSVHPEDEWAVRALRAGASG